MKHFNKKRYIEWTLLISVIAIAGFIWHEATEAYHFAVVPPGVLYRSGWMQPHGMNEKIKEHGIRIIVNLCLPSEEMSLQNNNYLREQEICRKNGVKLVHLPISGDTPPAQSTINQTGKVED